MELQTIKQMWENVCSLYSFEVGSRPETQRLTQPLGGHQFLDGCKDLSQFTSHTSSDQWAGQELPSNQEVYQHNRGGTKPIGKYKQNSLKWCASLMEFEENANHGTNQIKRQTTAVTEWEWKIGSARIIYFGMGEMLNWHISWFGR